MPWAPTHRPPPQTGDFLCKIPVELRLEIYLHSTIAREENIKILPRVAAKEPALLATCRIIRAEATQVHYKHSKFVFETGSSCRLVTSPLGMWLRQIGADKARMIESLILRYVPETERLAALSTRRDWAEFRAQERMASEQFLRAVMARGVKLSSIKIRVEEGKLLFGATMYRAYWMDSMRYAKAKMEQEERRRLEHELELKKKAEGPAERAALAPSERQVLDVFTCVVM